MVPHFAHAVVEQTAESEAESYQNYLAATSMEDRLWILRHQQYWPKPIVLERGNEGDKKRQLISGSKFRHFKVWAESSGENQELYRYVRLLTVAGEDFNVSGWWWKTEAPKLDSFKRLGALEFIKHEKQELHEAIQAIMEFLSCHKGIEELTIEFGTVFDPFMPQILKALEGHPTLRKLDFGTCSDHRITQSLSTLLTSPECKITHLVSFCGEPHVSFSKAIAAALGSTTAPIKSLELQRADTLLTGGLITLLSRSDQPVRELSLSCVEPKAYIEFYTFLASRDEKFKLQLVCDPIGSNFGPPSKKIMADIGAAYLKFLSSPAALSTGTLCVAFADRDDALNAKILDQVAKIPLRELDISAFYLHGAEACAIIKSAYSTLKKIRYRAGVRKSQKKGFSGTVLDQIMASCFSQEGFKCKLTTIELVGGSVSAAAASKLFEALLEGQAASLRSLSLSIKTKESIDGFVELLCRYLNSGSEICRLRTLDFSHSFNGAQMEAILTSLKRNTSIQKFYIVVRPGKRMKTQIDPQDLRKCCKRLAKHNQTIKEMKLPFPIDILADMCERNLRRDSTADAE
jgi:hypothetical protein